jgi:ABC-2 type transport system permease protein
MSDLVLAFRQVRYTNKAFWRNPASAFFTFAFPLMFLVIFTSLFGGGTADVGTSQFSVSTLYVPGIAAFSVITACYTNIAISVSFSRDTGILKRIHGTPLPGWAYVLARVLHASVIAVILVAIVAAFGSAFYDVDIPTGVSLMRFVVILVVGAASFSAMGLAITTVIPNADSSPAIVNASILPLLFLSGGLHPDHELHARLGGHGGKDLPDPSVRRRHVRGLPRHAVLVDRRALRRRVGPGGLDRRGPVL